MVFPGVEGVGFWRQEYLKSRIILRVLRELDVFAAFWERRGCVLVVLEGIIWEPWGKRKEKA